MTSQLAPSAARRLPLHERIVWARKRKGISQERLAGTIGTSRRHMIRIEKGLHTPGPVFRTRIAEATDQPEDFFTDEDDEESDPVDFAASLQHMFDRAIDLALARHLAAQEDPTETVV